MGFRVDDINPGVPLKGSVRVPLRASFKGSVGLWGLGFRVDGINPALPIVRDIPQFP